MKTDERLIPFFEKAKSKGWTQGEHLFKYLTEIEMHQYDTIHDTIQRAEGQTEGYAKALQGLDKLGMRIKGELLEAGKHNTDTSRTICLILNSILQDIEELQKLKPKAEEKESEQ